MFYKQGEPVSNRAQGGGQGGGRPPQKKHYYKHEAVQARFSREKEIIKEISPRWPSSEGDLEEKHFISNR